MAEKDEYIGEAYEVLKSMSEDEKNEWNMRRVKRQFETIILTCIVLREVWEERFHSQKDRLFTCKQEDSCQMLIRQLSSCFKVEK